MPRYKITIEFDGTPFSGWQIQSNGPSVQGELARAIERLTRQQVVPRGAGRTDAGVHARGQVAHFDLLRDFPAGTVRDALNFHLRPSPIAILHCEIVDAISRPVFGKGPALPLSHLQSPCAPCARPQPRVASLPLLNAPAMQEAALFLLSPRFHNLPRGPMPGKISAAHTE